MSIKELDSFIDNPNVAFIIEDMPDGEDKLTQIGELVSSNYQEDVDSMKEWKDFADKGIDLLSPELHTKDTPFNGAANFKHPIMMKASMNFANRASLEILRPKNLVKTEVIGKDESGEKQKSADRVSVFQNYQINHQLTGWRDKQKKLLYSLPSYGTVFKKNVYDPTTGKPESHLIQYPNFAISQGAESVTEARSFTQIHAFSRSEVQGRINAGLWRDVIEDIYPEVTGEEDSDRGSNEAESADNAEENPDRFFEQWTRLDLDDDGVAEPYIVTVHESSNSVVRIAPRYDLHTIKVKRGENDNILSLSDVAEEKNNKQEKEGEEVPEHQDFSDTEVIRIDALQDVVMYTLIPSFDGTLLGLGYFHLLGALTMGINTTTNMLLDSGNFANLQGGFLAKGAREKMGPLKTKPGAWVRTNLSPLQLQQGILPHPFKEPSQTLFALNEKMEAVADSLVASSDLSGQLTAQTAATTALAMIHESLIPLSALMDNVISSMSSEFKVLFNINRRKLNPVTYQTILDDKEADFEKDFNSDLMDVIPTANPEMSSKAQRIQSAESLLAGIPMILQAGGNPIHIAKNWVQAIDSDMAAQTFPEDQSSISPEDKKLMAAMTQAQEKQNELAQAQIEAANKQTQLLDRELSRLERESAADVRKTDADTEKTRAETEQTRVETKKLVDFARDELDKLRADITLTFEKAETEHSVNQISPYTARLEGITKAIDSIAGINNDTSTAASVRALTSVS